jgi:hypothetical protein
MRNIYLLILLLFSGLFAVAQQVNYNPLLAHLDKGRYPGNMGGETVLT